MVLKSSSFGRRGFIIFIFILPMWMNFLLRTMAWQVILEKGGIFNSMLAALHLPELNIINTPAAIVLGMVYDYLPFMVLPIYNVLLRSTTICLTRRMIWARQKESCSGP